ncbi:SurA N-terminal domain-containing protein [Desulfurivibrio sp. C05AmB]|jgi:peptidyl-prolyl cis-trans isomerase SurA|uniref:peptidylprolyl isomerase n=1 Tax=Desulfurivibrio sp. C05AmB TaxID=3374371 RepID=UPI00376EFC25
MMFAILGNLKKLCRAEIAAPGLALLLAAIFWAPQALSARVVDRVVAEVNGEVITWSELEQEVAPAREQILKQVPAAEHENVLAEARRQILAGLVDRLLVEQHAAKRGIVVGERQVDEALAQILADNRISEEELIRDLRRNQTTLANYRRDLRSQILQSRLLNLEVRERVVIPESRIREYYLENFAGRQEEAAYHILQMGFVWRAEDAEARREARRRAEQAREEVLAGGDFRSVARRHSDLPSGADGGDLGVFQLDELAGVMREHIPRLAPGELSPLLETPAGYQFFQLLSDRGDQRAQMTYEEARDEIRELLYRQALESQFTRWVGNLREDAYIRIML